MSNKRYRINFVHTTTLLMLRGVERWILEVSGYLSKVASISITTFSTNYKHISNLENRVNLVKNHVRRHNIQWLEVPCICEENIRAPASVKRFLKYHAIRIPLTLKVLWTAKGSITYVAVGDAISALFYTMLYTIMGARRIIIGLHSRPNYREFLMVKPILLLVKILGILKGIHTVNIEDTIVLRKLLKNIPIIFIPNGVDCVRFHPQFQKPRDKFRVLFVGALAYDKGVDVVIEVAKRLRAITNDVEVVIASVGGPLENLVVNASKQGIVKYLGFVPDEELYKLYAESHVVLLPSRDEAFNLVQLEAQASGTPIVAPDIVAFRVVIQNNVTGILVKRYNAEEFVKAILKVYNMWKFNETEYQKLAINARLNAEKFCWKRIVNLLIKYLFVIDQHYET